ncbi:MAG: hypothetical protein ACI4IK_00150 [Eubacterium sp.]
METINQVINTFKGFGYVEWGMVVVIVALLVTLLLYYKASMIAQRKLVQYEGEFKELKKSNDKLSERCKFFEDAYDELTHAYSKEVNNA